MSSLCSSCGTPTLLLYHVPDHDGGLCPDCMGKYTARREISRLRGELAHVTRSLLIVTACTIILLVLAIAGWTT